jgi:hypothetical protein
VHADSKTYGSSSFVFRAVTLAANELHVLRAKRKLTRVGGKLIRVVAVCLAVVTVAAGCENSPETLIGFPGGGGGAVTQAQASGDWSFTVTKTQTLACTGGSLADGQAIVVHLDVQSDGTVTAATSTWQNPGSGALLPASGSVRLADGVTDVILSSGSSGMELRGTLSSNGTFSGTLTDPAAGFSPMFSTGGCEYSAPGTKA